MRVFIKVLSVALLIVFSMTGCVQNTLDGAFISKAKEKQNLNEAIVDIARQLKQSSRLAVGDKGIIAVTTFVDLDKFDKTTRFGRILGESMFNELFVRGFNVTDFRGQGAISMSDKGEFYITRNTAKLENEIANTYVLVGTYAEMEGNILLNVRIIDNTTGKIASTARAIYVGNYCTLGDELCGTKSKRKIKIITDEQTNLI